MSIKRIERKHRGVGYRVYLRDDRGRQLTRTFDQMRDARAFEAQARVMKQSGTIGQLDAGNETLNEFVVDWFQNYAKPNLAAKTLSSYAGLLDRHILPRLGQMRLREI